MFSKMNGSRKKEHLQYMWTKNIELTETD